MMSSEDHGLDEVILQVFEEHEASFHFPVATQKEARAFVKALHGKGLSYDCLLHEIKELEQNFSAWRKGISRPGIGNRVIERINRPLQEILHSDGEDEDPDFFDQLSTDSDEVETNHSGIEMGSKNGECRLPADSKSNMQQIGNEKNSLKHVIGDACSGNSTVTSTNKNDCKSLGNSSVEVYDKAIDVTKDSSGKTEAGKDKGKDNETQKDVPQGQTKQETENKTVVGSSGKSKEFIEKKQEVVAEKKQETASEKKQVVTELKQEAVDDKEQVVPHDDLGAVTGKIQEAVTETEQVVAETKQAVAETKQAVTETKQAVTETKQAVTETKQAVTETKQAVAETKQAVTEMKQAVTETKQAVAERKQAVAETKQAVTEMKQAVTETKQAVAEMKQDRVAEKKQEAVAEKRKETVTEQKKAEEEKKHNAIAERKQVVTDNKVVEVTEKKQEAVTEKKQEAVTETKQEAVTEKKQEAVTEKKQEAVTEKKQEAVLEKKQEAVTEQKPVVAEMKQVVTDNQIVKVTEKKQQAVAEKKQEAVAEKKQEAVVEKKQEAITEKKQEAVTEKKQEAVTEKKQDVVTGIKLEPGAEEKKIATLTNKQKSDQPVNSKNNEVDLKSDIAPAKEEVHDQRVNKDKSAESRKGEKCESECPKKDIVGIATQCKSEPPSEATSKETPCDMTEIKFIDEEDLVTESVVSNIVEHRGVDAQTDPLIQSHLPAKESTSKAVLAVKSGADVDNQNIKLDHLESNPDGRDQNKSNDILESYDSDFDVEHSHDAKCGATSKSDNPAMTCRKPRVINESQVGDNAGYVYVFTDSSAEKGEFRVKVGASRFPHKKLQQSLLFNIDMKLVSAVQVSDRRKALDEVHQKLNAFSIPKTFGWFNGPLDSILNVLMAVTKDYPHLN